MRLYEFFTQAESIYLSGINWGQAHYNHLIEIRPDLAKQVKGTDADPFDISANRGKDNDTWKRFVAFLEEHWNKEINNDD